MKIDTCYDWNQSLLLIQTDFLPFLDFPQTRKILTSLSENPKHLFFFFFFFCLFVSFFPFPVAQDRKQGIGRRRRQGEEEEKLFPVLPLLLNLKFYQLLAQ